MNSTTDELIAAVEIEASPSTVWSLVTDVARMASWSPQVVKTVVLGSPLRQGTWFVSINHKGMLHWPTSARVTTFVPHTDFAFRITENFTVWSFHLEPVVGPGGALHCRLTQKRQTPHGISPLSKVLTRVALGGQPTFNAELQLGMEETLVRIKAEAEAL
jgi:uncharacterized protein YndB with AHSA1/START domain